MEREKLIADDDLRLAKIESMDFLTDPSEVAESITRLCVPTFGVPTALFMILDKNRQFIINKQGFILDSTPREAAFCSHTIQRNDIFEVTDALRDDRFRANPLVTGDPYIRYYCGLPLVIDGYAVGSLCLIDYQARNPLSKESRKFLKTMANILVRDLKSRHAVERARKFLQRG